MTKADKEGQRKAPILRFKGFTDDWEQRKLKNLITEPLSYGLSVSSKEYDGIHKYLRITDIDEKSRKFNKDKLTSPDIKFNSSSKKYLLSNNDIVFARTGASTGKTYMYQKEDGIVYYAGFLIKASLSSNFDNNFIFQQTYRKRYYQRVKVISQRSGQPGINSKEYGNFDFLITQIEEQNKIGKLFKIFDNLLALYERKIKLFDDMIAYLKQQLFYKQSSLFFPQSYWKDIAFSKLYIKRKDKNIDVSYDQSKTISVANMKYSDRELNSSREYLKTYYVTHFGDIIYEGNRSGNFKYGRFVQNDIGDGIVSHVFTVYKPIDDLDMNFMNNFINYEPIMSRVLLYATTDTLMMHTLHDNELMKQKLSLPDKETQIKIGRILSLVSTIKNRFSERKELLIKIKKNLLNTMFI